MKWLLTILFLLVAIQAQAQTSTMTINLSWTDNSNNEEGFYVYRDGAKLGQVAANVTTFSDTITAAWNTQFCYQVSAFNHKYVDGSGDLQESQKTLAACLTIPVPTQPAPAAPSNLTSTPISSSQLQLRWKDNANNETSQEILMAQSTPPRMWTIPVPASITFYRVDNLKKNTLYKSNVRAVGDGGVSDYSNQASATTKK